MWASHFVRNGNKLSISSWLTTEVHVCQHVGRPNPRPPNLAFFNFLQFLVELQFYVITETATAVINFSTTGLEKQPRLLKIPQPKQEPQPRFSENSQPIHHYITLITDRPSIKFFTYRRKHTASCQSLVQYRCVQVLSIGCRPTSYVAY